MKAPNSRGISLIKSGCRAKEFPFAVRPSVQAEENVRYKSCHSLTRSLPRSLPLRSTARAKPVEEGGRRYCLAWWTDTEDDAERTDMADDDVDATLALFKIQVFPLPTQLGPK